MALQRKPPLDERHRLRQQALQDRVAATLAALLASMQSLDEDALAMYVDHAYPVVAGGQHAAANDAAGYSSALALLTRASVKRAVDVASALERTGVLVTPESRSLVAPVLRARSLVAEGESEPAARVAASSYAEALSSNDMQAAQRVGLDEGVAAYGVHVRGYRKVVSPTCCAWCSLVGSDRVYRAADTVPFHERDKCGVAPVLQGE